MNKIQEIRHKKLKEIIDKDFRGSQTLLAQKMGLDRPTTISLCLSGRNIGDNLARKFELAAGKPKDWLDQEHDDEIEKLIEAIVALPPDRRHALMQFLGIEPADITPKAESVDKNNDSDGTRSGDSWRSSHSETPIDLHKTVKARKQKK